MLDSEKKSHIRDAAHAVLHSALDHLLYRREKPDDADGLAMCTLLVASGEIGVTVGHANDSNQQNN